MGREEEVDDVLSYWTTLRKRGKPIPTNIWTGPGGSKILRLPDFETIGS
jgi:hypothetical protein